MPGKSQPRVPAPLIDPTNPEIDIVNLGNHEFALLRLLRRVAQGQLELHIMDSRRVRVVRRRRLRGDTTGGRA